MKKNICLFPIICSMIALFSSCSRLAKTNVTGYYNIDKFIEKDTTVKSLVYEDLYINENNTFVLKAANPKAEITGNWEIVNSKSNKSGTIEFIFDKKRIQGKLEGNIFSFEFPDDFHNGKFEKVLYVKSNKYHL